MALCPICGDISAGKRITYNNFDVYDLCMKCASYSVCLISPNVEVTVKENAIRWAEREIQNNAEKIYLANCIRSWKQCAEDFVAAHTPAPFVHPAPQVGVLDIDSTEIDLDATIKSFNTGNYSAVMTAENKTTVDNSVLDVKKGNLFSNTPVGAAPYSPVQAPAPAPAPAPVYREPAPAYVESVAPKAAEEIAPAPVQAPAPFSTPAPFSAPVPFSAPYSAPVENNAAPQKAAYEPDDMDSTRIFIPDTVPEPIAPAPVTVPFADEFRQADPVMNFAAEEAVTPPEEIITEENSNTDEIEIFIDETPSVNEEPSAWPVDATIPMFNAPSAEVPAPAAVPFVEEIPAIAEETPSAEEEITDDTHDIKDYLREIALTLKSINEKMEKIEKEIEELKK